MKWVLMEKMSISGTLEATFCKVAHMLGLFQIALNKRRDSILYAFPL